MQLQAIVEKVRRKLELVGMDASRLVESDSSRAKRSVSVEDTQGYRLLPPASWCLPWEDYKKRFPSDKDKMPRR